MTTKAVIFDMDGVLIDSEPLWRRAIVIAFTNVGLLFTEEMCHETQGMRIDEVVEFWYLRTPWSGATQAEVTDQILNNVIELVKEQGVAKDGVIEALKYFKKQNVKLALASSSAMVLINAVIEKLGLENYFEILHSAEFEKYGKPHPGVYITAASKLGTEPQFCVAVEDSINGVISAKASKMRCLAIPDLIQQNDKKFSIADLVLSSLNDVDDVVWGKLNNL